MKDNQKMAEAKCSGQEPTPETLLYAAESYNLGLGMGMEVGFALLLSNLEFLVESVEDTLKRIKSEEMADMSDVIEDLNAKIAPARDYVAAEKKGTRSFAYLFSKIEERDPQGAMTLRALWALRQPQERMSRA